MMMRSSTTKPLASPGRPEKLPAPALTALLKGKSGSRSRGRGGGGSSRSSPMFVSRKRNVGAASEAGDDDGEPSSPKVTCIGQVRIRKKSDGVASSKLERRTKPKQNKWCSCLERALLCRCFIASKPKSSSRRRRSLWRRIWGLEKRIKEETPRRSKPIPSVVLEEEEEEDDDEESEEEEERETKVFVSSSTPPKNALLLMRCRSTPHNRASSLAKAAEPTPPPPPPPPALEVKSEPREEEEEEEEEKRRRRYSPSSSSQPHPLVLMRCSSAPTRQNSDQ